jgi:hypothetical protein
MRVSAYYIGVARARDDKAERKSRDGRARDGRPSRDLAARLGLSTRRMATIVLACVLCASAASALDKRVKPESLRPWAVEGDRFKDEDKRRGVSGLACAPLSPDFCLLATDEGHKAAFAKLREGRLEFIEHIDFADTTGEADAEGVAVDDRFFYVVGSHAVKRSGCKPNPSSRHVYRIGHNAGAPQGQLKAAKGDLWRVFEKLDALKPYAIEGACLGVTSQNGRNGVDIEGVAAAGGKLYFGLRGPGLNGEAFIVSVDADALFSNDETRLAASVYRIAVGEKRAFRDLTFSQGEILALVGPNDDSPPVDYSVIELKGLARGEKPVVRELATLDLDGVIADKPLKPEAIAILSANQTHYRALILSDQGMDGAPLVFDVPR